MSLRTNPWRGLGAALRGTRYRPRPAKARSWVPRLNDLEDRLAPAVVGNLYVVGSTLVYNGNTANNVITLSGSGGSLTLNDAAGTIVSNVPGMTAAGGTVSGTIPSYVQTIAVNGQNGADTLTVANGFSTNRNVILSATFITNSGSITTKNLTETGNTILLGGTVSTVAAPIGGSATFNGTVVTTAASAITTASVTNGNVTFNGVVSSPNPLTIDAGRTGAVFTSSAIVVTNGSDFTVLNAGSIHLANTTVNGNVSLTAQGGITLAGTLTQSNSADNVVINANQAGAGAAGFYQASGNIVTTGPLVAINVGGTANAQVADITTGTGGTVVINAGGGIQDMNGSALNVNAGAGGTLFASAGVGGISLDTAVGALHASTASTSPLTSPINIRNNGQPLTVDQLTTVNGSIALSNNDDVIVNGAITAGGPSQTVTVTTTAGSGAGDVTVNGGQTISAPGTGTQPGTVTINTPGVITSTGGSTPAVSANTVNLVAGTGISGTTGPLGTSLPLAATTVSATTNSGGIALANASALTVSQATATSGAITITTPLAGIPNPNDLVITGNVSTTGAPIVLDAGNSLTVTGPAIIASDQPVTLNAEYNLSVGAGSQVVSSGNITIDDGLGTFPLGTLPSVIDVSGSLISSGTVSISGGINNDVISVSGAVAAVGGLNIFAGLGADTLLLTPSTSTAYTIDLSATPGSGIPDGSADTVVIDAPSTAVLTATATGVTFTGASGFQSWTILGFNSAEGDTIPPYV